MFVLNVLTAMFGIKCGLRVNKRATIGHYWATIGHYWPLVGTIWATIWNHLPVTCLRLS